MIKKVERMITVNKEKMYRYSKLICNCAFYLLLFTVATEGLSSCKEKKEPEEIIVDRVVEKPKRQTQTMPDETLSGKFDWVGGKGYSYSILRQADENLSKVKNHDATYYDNSVTLVVKRPDDTEFFKKTFTKDNVYNVLPKQFMDSGVMLGMNFEKVDGNNLNFVVSVGSPDDSYDEFYHVLVTLNNYGNTSASVYKAQR